MFKSLSPIGTTGKQIIKGIENTYKNGEKDPKGYGNKNVLQTEMKLNGEKGKYRLVINEDKEVITFFKFKKHKLKQKPNPNSQFFLQ